VERAREREAAGRKSFGLELGIQLDESLFICSSNGQLLGQCAGAALIAEITGRVAIEWPRHPPTRLK